MSTLSTRALGNVPLTVETVEDIYARRYTGTVTPALVGGLCESHERLRAELSGAEILIAEMTAIAEALAETWACNNEGVKQCSYCLEWAGWKEEVRHKDECPVARLAKSKVAK
jgi:hypothetical protein